MRLNRAAIKGWAPGVATVLAVALLAPGASYAKPPSASRQLSFGIEMARRGLWNEAFFRFQQAAQLEPANPRIINNLAVASEARGNFEEALRFYQEALKADANNAEIKRNYARFVEFYQGYKAREETGEPEAGGEAPPQSGSGDG